MNNKVIARWAESILPQPGSAMYGLANMHNYTYHLALEFKRLGITITSDHIGSRQTIDTGRVFREKLLAMDDGGFMFMDHASRTMVLLFETGAALLEMGPIEDHYGEVDLDQKMRVTVNWCGTPPFSAELHALVTANTEYLETAGNVYAMLSTCSGPEFRAIGHGGEALIRENYSGDVLKSYDRIAETLQAKVPPGRINILSGPPGTGKTYLIRGLIEQVRGVRFAVVQASHVSGLANPGTLPALLEFRDGKQPIVFIIEDAEEVLATRDGGNNSAVSALLNMGDGVLGSLIDLRIIATTNSKVADLDHAIRRQGRLSTICDVGPLAFWEAADVYRRLTSRQLEGEERSYTIAEIYQMATDSGWRGEVKTQKRSVGFSAPSNAPMSTLDQIVRIAHEVNRQ